MDPVSARTLRRGNSRSEDHVPRTEDFPEMFVVMTRLGRMMDGVEGRTDHHSVQGAESPWQVRMLGELECGEYSHQRKPGVRRQADHQQWDEQNQAGDELFDRMNAVRG